MRISLKIVDYLVNGGAVYSLVNTSASDTRLRVFSDTDKLNITQIIEGKPVSDENNALITYNYAKANGINIGDDLELFGQEFNVCGYCLKPDYAAMFAEFSDTFPDSEYDVIISMEPLDIPQELLSKSASLDDYRSSSENAFRTAAIVLYIVKVIGALICVLVVVMLAGMIVGENRRSISLLEVLGYESGEIRSLILSSNHLIVPIGFLLGVPLGISLSRMIANTNAETSGMFMTIELTPEIFLTGMLFVGTAYILSLLLAGRKLRKVDMVECLKEDRE